MQNVYIKIRRVLGCLLAVFLLSWGCSTNPEALEECNRRVTVHLSLDRPDTRVDLHTDGQSRDMITKWQKDDKIIPVLFNGKYWMLDPVTVGHIIADGKSCIFEYELPKGFSIPEDGYWLWLFTESCAPTLEKSGLFYGASLIREPISSFRAPVMFEGLVKKNEEPFAEFTHYGTYEILHIYNNSDSPITFAISGYSSDGGIWYRTRGNINASNSLFVADTESGNTSVSDEITIPASSSDIFVSWYIPNGNMLSDVSLVAKINGEFLTTVNKKSSNVMLGTGRAYHLYVAWNGYDLKFVDGNLDMNKILPERERVTLETGGATHLLIENGSDGFSAVSNDENVATTFMTQNVVNIIANNPGQCIITVSDTNPERGLKNAEILVTVREPAVPEAIDLGLSVNWASFNLGATKPEELGDYFAWGEVKPYYEFGEAQVDYPVWLSGKEHGYDWSSYSHCNGTAESISKYGEDGKLTLELEDDAARENWGGEWRLPTKAEMDELREECTWDWTTEKGVPGVKITSKKEGYADKYIFLPAAGQRFGLTFIGDGSVGSCWTTSVDASSSKNAFYYYFGSTAIGSTSADRVYGRSIRPVSPKQTIPVESVSLDKTAIELSVGGTSALATTVLPDNATNKNVIWTSDNETVATVTSTGTVKGVAKGNAIITVSTVDGGKTATCNVTVKETSSSVPVPEAIDLGLSVMWASFNLGASAPKYGGKFYAWGETEPYYDKQYPLTWKEGKERGYWWSSYTWGMGNGNALIKYCYNPEYGYNEYTDGKMILDLEDDAAHVALGDKWRMPTREEFNELLEKCTWEITKLDGTNGRLVTGPNGNSIFLPSAGYWDFTSQHYSYGDYWSSSLQTTEPRKALNLYFSSTQETVLGFDRYYGCSIRPVYGDPKVTIVKAESVSLNKTSISLSVGETTVLSASVLPGNATNKTVYWSSSDKTVATVTPVGEVTGVTAGSVLITATAADGGWTASCSVTVRESSSPFIPKAIDLGLPSGTKWATCNLGTTIPLGYGDYYAWGETATKDEYNWEAYIFSTEAQNTLTKYCNNAGYGFNGFTDEKTVLEPEDDAAHVRLGDGWRIPLQEDWLELNTYCYCKWLWINGTFCLQYTSSINGNQLLIPAGGKMEGNNGIEINTDGYYWSSSLYVDNPNRGYCMSFDDGLAFYSVSGFRYFGYSIRPVYGGEKKPTTGDIEGTGRDPWN